MNESAVRLALKKIISNSEAQLVSGLTNQGNPRRINQITTSSLTPPNGYYFISIITSENFTTNASGYRNTLLGPSEASYGVVIEIADYAMFTYGEDEAYEQMDSDFQIFTDRIVSKLRESFKIIDPDTNKEYFLDQERRVIKTNLSEIWEDAAQYHAMLNATITFRLNDKCTDADTLY